MHNYLPLRLVSSYVCSGCIRFITIPTMHLSAQVFSVLFQMHYENCRGIAIRWIYDQIRLLILALAPSCSPACDLRRLSVSMLTWCDRIRWQFRWHWHLLLYNILYNSIIESFVVLQGCLMCSALSERWFAWSDLTVFITNCWVCEKHFEPSQFYNQVDKNRLLLLLYQQFLMSQEVAHWLSIGAEFNNLEWPWMPK